jgi:tRNA(Ile)-lysidine synthase
VSGGVDSVVMCDLFKKSGFLFDIAHCNFQLRGIESEKDGQLVLAIAKKYNSKFFYTKFDTLLYSKKNKLSIQEAARDLRYSWFEKIRVEKKLKYIATAHHKNDNAETVLFNFIRGTGISGLHGIKSKRENIIRPLLFASKDELINYAKQHKLKFREDRSNKSDKYTRNKIRNKIIPLMEEINPQLVFTIAENASRIQKAEEMLSLYVSTMAKKIFRIKKMQF